MKRQWAASARADAATVEALFYAAPVGFAVLDRDLVIVNLNGAMSRLLGERAQPGAELRSFPLGRAIESLCRGVVGSSEPAWQEAFTERGRFYALVFPVILQESAKLGAIVAEVKSPGTCAIVAPKTESIARLAAAVAHHFNNLLTGIMGGASLALDRLAPGHPARPAIEIIADSSQRAAELTQRLLAYSGGAPTRISIVDLEAAVRRICAEMRASIPEQVELRVEPAGSIPHIKIDEIGFEEALKALITNAAEAIGDRRGRISVVTRSIELGAPAMECDLGAFKPGLHVEISVSDTGAGMSAETKAKMFEPFYSTKLFGRGLGLATVQHLVRLHGGCARVRTEPGGGTTVSIFLRQDDGSACPVHAPL